MANYFSDHYTNTVGGTAEDNPRIKAPPGLDHATVRYKRGTVTPAAGVTDDEQCRFFQMKSSDRIHALYASGAVFTGSSMTADAGLYRTDGGTVIDLDLFCAAGTAPLNDLSASAWAARTDLFSLAALEDQDRGKALWELADEGGGTYSADPIELWDIVITMNTESSITAAGEMILEVFYTAGGS